MVSRKYAKDYRLEPYLDSSGRIRDRAVYCGAYYVFEAPMPVIRRRMLWLIAATVMYTACVLVPLLIPNLMTRQMYVMLPQCAALIPVYMFSAAIWRIATAAKPVIREHKERIVRRMRMAVIVALVFSGISLIGAIVALCIVDGLGATDWLVAVCSLIRTVLCVLILPLRTGFLMKESESAPKDSEQ